MPTEPTAGGERAGVVQPAAQLAQPGHALRPRITAEDPVGVRQRRERRLAELVDARRRQGRDRAPEGGRELPQRPARLLVRLRRQGGDVHRPAEGVDLASERPRPLGERARPAGGRTRGASA
jgi:hypothetical protein